MTSAGTKVILHAEDEPAHAAIVRRSIQSNFPDVQLRQVGDGKAALDYLYRRGIYKNPAVAIRPDLILLDLHLPGISGLEFLAIVKKDSKLQSIPVVVLTTSDLLVDRSAAHVCGVDGYLVKPDDFDKFVAMMNELRAAWL